MTQSFFTNLIVLGLCATPLSGIADGSEIKPLNVVIIYMDDMGWKDLGCYGSTFYETPNIDRLCSEGMKFTDAYSACNVCSPSRHALLTGKYPTRSHFTNVLNWKTKDGRKLSDPVQDDVLNGAEITFAEVFRQAGYRTGFFGKWHMNFEQSFSFKNGAHGFAVWDGIPSEGGWTPPRIVEDVDDPKEVSEITDKSIAFVRAAVEKKTPFLLYMAHHTVHVELQTTTELHEKYSAKAPAKNGQNNPFMGGMIEDLDTETGRFLDILNELEIADKTVIIFTSDNGGQYNQFDKTVTRQTPLRGGKGDAYEGGTRVPLIIKWPGVMGGGVSDLPTITMDLYPTLLEIAGLKPDSKQHLDGCSLVPVLMGEPDAGQPVYKREEIFWHYPHYKAITQPYSSIRKGDYKLIVYHEWELAPSGGKAPELFNLKNDIGESKNLATAMPEKAAELYRDLKRHRKTLGAQMPSVNSKYRKKEAEISGRVKI